jgi:hypothetical protein
MYTISAIPRDEGFTLLIVKRQLIPLAAVLAVLDAQQDDVQILFVTGLLLNFI